MASNPRALLRSVLNELGDRLLLILAHVQPYAHSRRNGELECFRTKSGVVTALDPVLQHCGGIWVGLGITQADRDSADPDGCLGVPPWDPKYILKRVFLTPFQWRGYYDRAAIGGFWPLFHNVHVMPRFSQLSWKHYLQVNQLMADAALKLIGNREALVWIQDFQLTSCAKFIHRARPDLAIAHFWHIPWPPPEVFRICPWAEQILESMLHSELIGFQTKLDACNFMDCVQACLQAKLDRDSSTILYRGTQTKILDFPVSIDFQQIWEISVGISDEFLQELKQSYRINAELILVGVDRMDYTKGLIQKLLGLDQLFRMAPELVGKLSLVQVASPSRAHLPEYIQYSRKVHELAQELNRRYSDGNWQPVILIDQYLPYEQIIALYKLGQICLVSSLRDGMNLVCKEFLAANPQGALVLSKFAGASHQLKDAILIDPHIPQQVALGIKQALEMDPAQIQARAQRMREQLREYDTYRWAAEFLAQLINERAMPRSS